MRKIIDCNGVGLPDYPEKIEIKTASVWLHDSGMLVQHDYPCTVCSEEPAVLNLGTGIFQPCRTCESKGYRVTQTPPSFNFRKKLARILRLTADALSPLKDSCTTKGKANDTK